MKHPEGFNCGPNLNLVAFVRFWIAKPDQRPHFHFTAADKTTLYQQPDPSLNTFHEISFYRDSMLSVTKHEFLCDSVKTQRHIILVKSKFLNKWDQTLSTVHIPKLRQEPLLAFANKGY